MSRCGTILKSGKNKGKKCNVVVSYKYEDKYFCGRHCNKDCKGRVSLSLNNKCMLDSAYEGDLSNIEMWYEKGVDVNYATKNGTTVLSIAASKGRLAVVKFLYEKGADIMQTDEYGKTALREAACNGYLSVVKFLYRKGADIHDVSYETTALKQAVYNNHFPVVKFLCEAGANIEHVRGIVGLPFWKESYLSICEVLCKVGVNVEGVNCYGDTALTNVAMYGDLSVVKFLCSIGANIKHRNKRGETAIMIARKHNKRDIVEFLFTQEQHPVLPLKNLCAAVVYRERVPHDHIPRVMFDLDPLPTIV